MLTGDWLTDWETRLRAATERAVRDVLSTYPYEPDEHRIGPPATSAELAVLREADHHLTAAAVGEAWAFRHGPRLVRR